MTLLAGLAPEKFFRISGSFCYPLCRSEYAYLRRQRLAAQIASWIALHANLGRMSVDVLLKLFDQERVHDFRFVVRNAVLEALVECQQMTCCAGVSEFYRRHKLAAGDRLGWFEALNGGRKKLIAVFVADCRGAIFRIRKSWRARRVNRASRVILGKDPDTYPIDKQPSPLDTGIELTATEYADFVRLAGNEFKVDGLGMHLLKTIYFSDIPRIRKTAL